MRDGIRDGPVALATSFSQIAFATILTVILIEKICCYVRDGKSGRLCTMSSRVGFAEYFLAKILALSLEDANTSGPLKRL